MSIQESEKLTKSEPMHPFEPFLYDPVRKEVAAEDMEIKRKLQVQRRIEGEKFDQRRIIYHRPGNNI